ncbi:protein mono-ADP-ribosyltransferase PARP9 [Pleuronectes platessa]|uniref:protein mono-ADP-ribosyltransferase PARP9 n=1 Tax=Pleuronectes platessa TaxID=8262 RepID=UPI00232A3B16|nr:protein mono-ADP-ribosyltransferase PARP9 [Pleuronectes platessa]
MAGNKIFPLQGPSVDIVRNCGPSLVDILHSKFGCMAIIEGMASESFPTLVQQITGVTEKRFAGMLSAGIKLSVWKADLTNIGVDAVVNAANIKLQHFGGLARALSNKGGPQIQQDSDDYIRWYGELKTGDAIVCDPGFLQCKKLIHAVGPDLPYNPSRYDISQAKLLLQKAIRSILDRVKECHLKTVAIPAISSGLFNFPLPLCADTIVSTVIEYYEKSSTKHLPEEILLVNHDDPSVKEMERACCEQLSQKTNSMNSKGAGAGAGKGAGKGAAAGKGAGKGAGAGAGAAKSSSHTVQFGNIQLTLKRGRIEEQEADVIVNTTSSDRNLSYGDVTRALLKKAGAGMQRELRSATPIGKVLVTKGYSLKCKEVFHTFDISAREVLFSSVLDCLYIAVSNEHRSIAFPAIGTGGHGLSKTQVAEVMIEAVKVLVKKSPQTLEVHFVIFPSEEETYKAFETAMGSYKQKAPDPGFTQASEHRDRSLVSKPAAAPQISLHGSAESMLEADRWLWRLFEKTDTTVTIRNNFILCLGEEEHLQLTRLSTKKNINFKESFNKGHADITVKGDSREEVVVAALKVEVMLCNIQREFVKKEERAILPSSTEKVTFERTPVDIHNNLFSERGSVLTKEGLCMLKLEKVENPTLRKTFDTKKQQLQCSTQRTMFQLIPSQFCKMVSHIGFHAEYAPPADPAYGEGIYFAGTVRKALEVWKERNEAYLYLVEAEVLTGNSTPGRPGLILPDVGTHPQIFESVSGGPDLSVIFSGYQALPTYITTCTVD